MSRLHLNAFYVQFLSHKSVICVWNEAKALCVSLHSQTEFQLAFDTARAKSCLFRWEKLAYYKFRHIIWHNFAIYAKNRKMIRYVCDYNSLYRCLYVAEVICQYVIDKGSTTLSYPCWSIYWWHKWAWLQHINKSGCQLMYLIIQQIHVVISRKLADFILTIHRGKISFIMQRNCCKSLPGCLYVTPKMTFFRRWSYLSVSQWR